MELFIKKEKGMQFMFSSRIPSFLLQMRNACHSLYVYNRPYTSYKSLVGTNKLNNEIERHTVDMCYNKLMSDLTLCSVSKDDFRQNFFLLFFCFFLQFN